MPTLDVWTMIKTELIKGLKGGIILWDGRGVICFINMKLGCILLAIIISNND